LIHKSWFTGLCGKVSDVNKDGVKRVISFAVFGLGILGGLWSCSRYSFAMFVAGENDSFPGFLAITLAFATPLPACVLALWKRIPAGLWLIAAGCYFPLGMLFQRVFMIYVRHFPDQDSVRQTLMISLPYSSVLIALGSFGVVTGILKWPKLL
jgi:hypothetical protein